MQGGSYTNIATLPSGYGPNSDTIINCWAMGGAAFVGGYIYSSGQISLYSNVNTSYWAFSVAFSTN